MSMTTASTRWCTPSPSGTRARASATTSAPRLNGCEYCARKPRVSGVLCCIPSSLCSKGLAVTVTLTASITRLEATIPVSADVASEYALIDSGRHPRGNHRRDQLLRGLAFAGDRLLSPLRDPSSHRPARPRVFVPRPRTYAAGRWPDTRQQRRRQHGCRGLQGSAVPDRRRSLLVPALRQQLLTPPSPAGVPMDTITRDDLEAVKAQATAALTQAIAEANAAQGALNVITALLAQLDRPEPLALVDSD